MCLSLLQKSSAQRIYSICTEGGKRVLPHILNLVQRVQWLKVSVPENATWIRMLQLASPPLALHFAIETAQSVPFRHTEEDDPLHESHPKLFQNRFCSTPFWNSINYHTYNDSVLYFSVDCFQQGFKGYCVASICDLYRIRSYCVLLKKNKKKILLRISSLRIQPCILLLHSFHKATKS